VKLLAAHAAVAPLAFPPTADAAEQRSVTALTGTVKQPGKVLDVAPTLSVQVPPLLLLFIVKLTVAFELPGACMPGAMPLKEIVPGEAIKLVMVVWLPLPELASRWIAEATRTSGKAC
jgi:hypothetical protein